jgi:hypothetical protein
MCSTKGLYDGSWATKSAPIPCCIRFAKAAASSLSVRASNTLRVSLGTRIERIYKQAQHGCFRHYFMQ